MANKGAKIGVREIILIVIIVFLAIIIIQNMESVNLRVLFMRVENIPKFLLIGISIIAGMGIQTLINLSRRKK
jgi:uncharacterized integral membrane protein